MGNQSHHRRRDGVAVFATQFVIPNDLERNPCSWLGILSVPLLPGFPTSMEKWEDLEHTTCEKEEFPYLSYNKNCLKELNISALAHSVVYTTDKEKSLLFQVLPLVHH